MRIDGPQVTSSLSLNGTTITDLNIFVTTGSLNGITGSYATTGSNTFIGTQTLSGSIIPAVNNIYDLGSPTHQFRHVYISSGSLYIDGTKVLGSTSSELQITTDTGQSFKVLETGADTITLQSNDGNVTLTATGGGDIVMDPSTGVIGLKGTVSIYTGNKIVSSDGNAIQFGNGIAITGSIVATGTALVSGSSQITYGGLSAIPSGILSGSAQLPSGIVSSSTQLTSLGYATTGSNNFQGTQTITGSLYISSDLVVQGSSSLENITASSVNIGANIVNLNTANPAIRFAGMSVFDSGSIGGSGSFLYDSIQDEFIFVHRGDNVNITSSVALMGPQTYNDVGNEIYPTANRILKGTGNEHVGDSIISETNSSIGISGSLSITGSIVATGTSLVSGSSQILNGSGIWSGSAQLPSGIISGSIQVDVLSTTNIARLATTGSNTFNGNQIVSGSFKVSGSIESSYDGLATEGGQLILRGPVNRYNVDNWSGNALRIFREDDATAANGNVIIFASGSGQVGINKNATNATLDVNGNTLVSGSLTATNMNVFGTTELAYVNGTTQMRISRSGAVARLQNYENGSVSNIILNWEGGNLGVGVTDPSTALDVYKIGSGGALTGAAMTLRSGNASDTSGSQQILFSYSGTTLYRHSIRTRHMSDAAAGNAIDFYTWKYGTDVNSAIGTQHVMTIDGNAMVGIGTTTPGQTLELKSADGQGLRLKNAGSSDKRWDIVGSGNDLRINETGVGAVMTIKAGGTIGIGNTNPKFYLHSNDDVTIPNNRYLNFTSEINAANFNKSLVVSYTDDSATSQPNQLGLILHNNSNTDNTFSPALVFGSKSASNNYSQATAAIAGKRITLQQDPNWHSGELYFWTATSGGSSINQGIPADAPAMILDSRRRMRVPSQPSFQVHRGNAANFTISNTSDGTVLPFNVVRHDSASNYNNSTYRFTAPIGGRYFFSATVRWDGSSSGSYLRTFFTVNGSSGQGGSAFNYGHAINGPSGYSSNYQSLTVSAVIQLAAGDYVSVVGGINVGSTDMHAESQFSGYMLG